MKSAKTFFLLLILSAILGCDKKTFSPAEAENGRYVSKTNQNSSQLTNDSAKRAIEDLMNFKGGGAMITANVLGIQEEGNAARADVNFTGSLYSMDRGTTYQATNDRGVAVFTHYNDGRWVLTQVSYGPQMGFHVNGNVPVTELHY